MQLLGSFFEIVDRKNDEGAFSTTIRFFPGHEIFKAHFPGHPVTPGVVFLQLVHELLENYLRKTLRLSELSNCKFLRVVNPEVETLVEVLISVATNGQSFQVKGLAKNNTGIIFKLDAEYFTTTT